MVFGGDRRAANKLKSLVTEPTIMIEPKFVDAFPVRNNVRLILASNEDSLLAVDHDDRRWLVLRVSDRRANDRGYFGPLFDEMQRGGPASLLHYLTNYKFPDDVNLRVAPPTEAKGRQKDFSLSPAKRWWKARLEDEYLTRSDEAFVRGDWLGTDTVEVSRGALYHAFVSDAIDAGRGRGRLPTAQQLWLEVEEVMRGAAFQRRNSKARFPDWEELGADDGVPRRLDRLLRIAPLAQCRAAWERWLGQKVEWPESTGIDEEETPVEDNVF